MNHLKQENELQYNPESYWGERFKKVGLGFRGPGDWGLSNEKNEIAYQKAKKVFLDLCAQKQIDLIWTSVLEIGTGNGFYAQVLREANVGKYLGIDITDVLFDKIQTVLPGLNLMKLDIGERRPPGRFDLVIMIDVTQHITDNKKFSAAMQNIRACLMPNGFLIITDALEDRGLLTFHYRSRGMNAFTKEFKDDRIDKPILFRDKYIFTIQKKEKNVISK